MTAAPAAPRRRSWAAARPDRLTKFQLWGASPRLEARQELRGLVDHARHGAQNFDHARAYERLVRRHVIGPEGIRLEMDVREPGTARDPRGRPDRLANVQIAEAWARWGAQGMPTPCGRLSWWDVERIAATALAREGGFWLRLWRGRGRGPFGLEVEPLAFDLLDLDRTEPLRGGAWIDQGVEYTSAGRLAAFHFWTAEPGDGLTARPRRRVRVPARDVVQVWEPEEVAQVHGLPRSATALRLMSLGDQFREAGMAAANYGASLTMFFQQEDAGQVGAPASEPPVDQLEAGTTAMLPPGVTAHPHQPHYPEAAVEPFMRHMGQTVAAGLGVSYETLTSDLSGANFSSLRAGKGEERDEWRMLQKLLAQKLHGRVFEAFLEAAMLTGAMRLPMAKFDKFARGATWRPRGWASVNPKEDSAAAEADIRNGVRSRTEVVAARGRDFAEVVAELAAERAALEAAGLPSSTAMPGQAAPAQAGGGQGDAPGDGQGDAPGDGQD